MTEENNELLKLVVEIVTQRCCDKSVVFNKKMLETKIFHALNKNLIVIIITQY